MKTPLHLLAVGLGLAAATACSSDIGTERITGYQVSVQTDARTGKTQSVVLDTATAWVTRVGLVPNCDDTTTERLDVQGSYTVDLLTGLSSPAFPTAAIPVGVYEGLRIDFGEHHEDTTVLKVTGTLDGTPFRFTVNRSFRVRYRDSTGIAIDSTVLLNLQVYLPLASALDALDITNADLTPAGLLLIDEDHNEDLYRQLLDELDVRSRVHRSEHPQRGRGRGRHHGG